MPDYIVDAVENIDFSWLSQHGVRACLIDLDGTVVARGTFEVNPKIIQVLKNSPQKIYIATNRPKSRDLKNLKKDLNAAGVIHPKGLYGKPFKRYFSSAAKELNLNTKEVLMIGDRFLQDIFGANRAGMRTLLVLNKIGPAHYWFDKLISITERQLALRFSRKYQAVK